MLMDILGSINKDFLEDLIEDRLNDWIKAQALGEAIVTAEPTVLIGHLILCRALRHMGDRSRAIKELAICLAMAPRVGCGDAAFLPEVRKEELLLSQGDVEEQPERETGTA